MVRTKTGYGSTPNKPAWLLIKHRDEFASQNDVLTAEPRSVKSKRLLAEIAEKGHGNVAKAAKGDPPGGGPKS